MRLSTVFLALALAASVHGNGQAYNFAAVDSIALSVGKADSISIPQLAYVLIDRYKDPVMKARAIYTWMAHHISYDCPAYHNPTRRKSSPGEVFLRRKAVCEGYANLFMELCNHAGVMCLVIDGFARNGSEAIGEEMKEGNHAWNAIRIGDEWKMIDVTWASGYVDKKVRTFTQEFSGAYFMADPQRFLLNHYPTLSSWKPAKAALSKKEFFDHPAIHSGYLEYELRSFTPENGIIRAKANQEIGLSFGTAKADEVVEIAVAIGEEGKEQWLKPEFTISNGVARFSISYPRAGSYPLRIFVNNRAVLQYRLDIQ